MYCQNVGAGFIILGISKMENHTGRDVADVSSPWSLLEVSIFNN